MANTFKNFDSDAPEDDEDTILLIIWVDKKSNELGIIFFNKRFNDIKEITLLANGILFKVNIETILK